jgi:hypothetical protein
MENLNKHWKIGDSALIIKRATDKFIEMGLPVSDTAISQFIINELACDYESLMERYLKLEKKFEALHSNC